MVRFSAFAVFRAFGCLAFVAFLAGCAGVPSPFGPATDVSGQPGLTGQGAKVGLILPLSATGNAGVTARSLQRAAEMALAELNDPNSIHLIVKDGQGTAQGSQQAAQALIQSGVQLILGPVFGSSVEAVKPVAQSAGVPVLAYSTQGQYGDGRTFLFSFLPQSDVDQIVRFATAQGKTSFAAYIPDTAYGHVVESAFQSAVQRYGGQIKVLKTYPLDTVKLTVPVTETAAAAGDADAIFIPDAPQTAALIVSELKRNGVGMDNKMLLGTGLWDDQIAFQSDVLRGAYYAAPDPQGFANFRARYRSRFNSDPVRLASLSFDSVRLAAALSRAGGGLANVGDMLTNPNGFSGVDGIFRFTSNGLSERGLAILQVTESGGTLVRAAPQSF